MGVLGGSSKVKHMAVGPGCGEWMCAYRLGEKLLPVLPQSAPTGVGRGVDMVVAET